LPDGVKFYPVGIIGNRQNELSDLRISLPDSCTIKSTDPAYRIIRQIQVQNLFTLS